MSTNFIILVVIFIILLLITAFMCLPILFGAPFEPSRMKRIKLMLKFSSPKKGQKVAELGSGNGKVAIEFAKVNPGIKVDGYEINPLLVLYSRRRIKKLGLEKQIKIYWKNFWKINLSKYDIISVFQVIFIMPKLEKKLKAELKPGAKVISNEWKFPNWHAKKSQGEVSLYVKEK